MFKYTKEALSLIIEDFKKYMNIFKYGSLIMMSGYFIYALVMQTGNFIANIILATLFVLYTLYEFLIMKKLNRETKRVVKRSYKWSKLLIKTFTLVAMLYGIYTATINVSAISTILATLMIILWILQVLLEIVVEVIEDKVNLVIEAFEQDKEEFFKPVTSVGNVIKKIKGEEIVIEEDSKNVKLLAKRIKEKKDKKKVKEK